MNWTIRDQFPGDVRPFCHFDRDGKICFQGYPEQSNPPGDHWSPGDVKRGCTFTVPAAGRGKRFAVYVALWSPRLAGSGNNEERLLPDGGSPDRRVLIGEFHVAEDGQATFSPTSQKSP